MIMKKIWMIISLPLLMLAACTSDTDAVTEEITLTTPVIELEGVEASTRASILDGTTPTITSDLYLHVWLHNSDARQEDTKRHGMISFLGDDGWFTNQPVSVTDGEGNYRAGIIVPVSWGNGDGGDFMPELNDAIYGYRGSIYVSADGTFTPSGKLVPYSAGMQVILKDANGKVIDPDKYDTSNGNSADGPLGMREVYTIKPVGLACMAKEEGRGDDLTFNLFQSFAAGNDGQRFPNGTAPAVPAAKTNLSMSYSNGAYGSITPGTYPATWAEGGALIPSAAPTAPWPLFEVTYCADGFDYNEETKEYDAKGPFTTWTVSYPAAQLTLEAGKLYTFTIGLGKDAHITLDAQNAVTIASWATGSEINVGR